MRLSTCMAVLALASAPLPVLADGAVAARPLADVLREAARVRKPILLDFSTVW